MKKIRILIADDHPIVREGYKKILMSQPDMDVTGEAGNATWDVPLLVRTGGKTAPVLVEPGGTHVPDAGVGPVVVNAGATDFRCQTKSFGEVLLPPNGFVVESPTFAAFHASYSASVAAFGG